MDLFVDGGLSPHTLYLFSASQQDFCLPFATIKQNPPFKLLFTEMNCCLEARYCSIEGLIKIFIRI